MAEKLAVFLSQTLGTKKEPIFSEFDWQFLVQRDSWFSTNTLKPVAATNMLQHMVFPQRSIAINCADPGDTLANMVKWRRDPLFYACLAGPKERPWSAIFLSAGGNDLIAAVNVPAIGTGGMPTVPHDRLLLTSNEWGGPLACVDNKYICAEGWENFTNYLTLQFKALDFIRSQSRDNLTTPIFTHTYDYATPRASPAGPGLGPWLLPALQGFQIPVGDWSLVANAFIDKLAAIILNLKLANFRVVDTRTTLTRASPSAKGVSNDWENEIHPTAVGYEKLAPKFVNDVCSVLPVPASAIQSGLGAAVPPVVAQAVPPTVIKRKVTPRTRGAHA